MNDHAKTRALRKYEAAPERRGHDAGDPDLDLYFPFGPMIVRAEVSQALTERINRYADAVVQPDTGGEFLLPKSLVFEQGDNSLAALTEKLIRRYLVLMDEPGSAKITIDVFWVVSQRAGTPSPVHFHTGDISGVLYLRTPELVAGQEEDRKTYISGRQAGQINFLIGGKQRFSKSLVSFRPRVGDFYIFPGWLLHGAEPFRGRGERRSLAFNAFVEAEGSR